MIPSSPADCGDHPLTPVPYPGGLGAAADLPRPLTTLVGRAREVAVALALLERPDVRLLTLTGPGGIGKTRLAIAVARAAAFPNGVRFVSLATVSESSLVAAAIAHALGIPEGDTGAPREALAVALRDADQLLVLDNFEHLLAAAPLLTDLLAACPRLRLLVTSRSLLRVTGEHALPVPPLSLPSRGGEEARRREERVPLLDSSTSRLLDSSEAVQLFAARARAVNPAFELTDESAPLVAEICRRLDGLPLAIELAAARANHLPLPALWERLEWRLPVLTGGSRDAPRRLRSMRDAIAWSHELLDPETQGLFRRLAVFAGGCTLDAAEAVGGDVLVGIAALVEASLLRHESDPDGTARYWMLETVREFASEQLAASEEEAVIRRKHASYFLELAEKFPTTPFLPDSPCGVDRRDAERANLRTALAWLAGAGRSEEYAQLAGALGWFWLFRGYRSEVHTMLERARPSPGATPAPNQTRVALAFGMASMAQGDLGAAEQAAAESHALALAANDTLAAAQALIIRGAVLLVGGELDAAAARLEEARRLGQTLSDPRQSRAIISSALSNLGVVAHSQGQIALAMAYHEEGLAGHRAIGDCWGELHALVDLGDVARSQGDLARASAYYREGLALGWRSGQRRAVFEAFEGLACAAAAAGQAARAARWLATVERARTATGLSAMDPVDAAAYAKAMSTARTMLGEEAFAVAWAVGRTLPLDEAVAEALDPATLPREPLPISLTLREAEILRLLIAGQTDREIGEALFVSVRTVEAHVSRILAKLGVRSRTAAVSAAFAAGLVEPTCPTPATSA
jgi:predicted ATPase/DNA-binding NarL/FixJ family response regulator